MNIGYIGLGNMGGALAKRLQLSHPLCVFDRNPVAVQELVEAGATSSGTAAELAGQCELIFLCLPTSQHVSDVLFGSGGIAEGLAPGTMIVDQTSGDPSVTRELAARLDEHAIHLVDAPVSGGPDGAAAGTIAIMVGASELQYARIATILRSISPNVFHTGDVGTGHTMKLVNNVISCAQRALTLEALSLGAKNGIAPEKAIEILRSGGASNAFLVNRASEVVKGHMNAGFSVGLAHKDVRLACQLGADSGVPMLYGSLTRELYQMCINEVGRDSKVDTVALVMNRLAGTAMTPETRTASGQG